MAGRGGRGAALLQALENPARKPGQTAAQANGAGQQRTSPPLGQQQPQYGAGPQGIGRSTQPGIGQPPSYGGLPPGGRGQPGFASPQQALGQPGGLPPQLPGGRGQILGRGFPQPQSFGRGMIPGQQTPPAQAMPAGRGQPAMLGRGFVPPAQSQQPQMPVGRGMTPPQQQPSRAPVEQQPQVPQPQVMPQQQPRPQQQQQQPRPAQPSPVSQGPPTDKMAELSLEKKPAQKGTSGQTVPLNVNYIRLKTQHEGVYQYVVSYRPEVEDKNMRYNMMKREHLPNISEVFLFDGVTLYLPFRLERATTVVHSVRPSDGMDIEISITLTKVMDYGDPCLMQMYNKTFRKILSNLRLERVGQYHYNPLEAATIPQHRLEVWPGYITAVHQYEGGILLLADISHRLLRSDSVLDVMGDIYNRSKNFQEEVIKSLVGQVVLTRYNNKTYRIDDIVFNQNPQSTFVNHSGEQMSYRDYFKKQWNKDINDLNQPLLVHRPKKKDMIRNNMRPRPGQALEDIIIMLVPELCSLTGLTDAMRSDFKVMKDIGAHTRVSPMQRQAAMRKFIKNVYANKESVTLLNNWGLTLDQDILSIEGRQLPPEKILMGKKSFSAGDNADWGRDCVREQVITPVHLQDWMVCHVNRDRQKANEFIATMKKVTPCMGIEVRDPMIVVAPDDRTDTYLRVMRENITPMIQVVVVIFPTSRDDRYAAVKKLFCVECPVPSQVINVRTIANPGKIRSVTQKIALQINCKLGGELWALDVPMKSLMVIGIDSYHDASRGGRSVGGFVASLNRSLTRWYSRVCFQLPGQELVDGLKMCITQALKKYHEINHSLPEKIVVYRDGVGDGQLPVVSNYEVKQLSDAFVYHGVDYKPKLAVVVVQKRINTRIFKKNGNQLDNPMPGTIVDHTIVRKDWYDFFLISQFVRQGTVTPSHYVVVHDSTGMKPDHMQRLTYKLTHLYYNWPGTIRVPAPCQYAHKLAFLVGQSIHKEPSLALCDKLFFL